jgi:TatD DNase family protein
MIVDTHAHLNSSEFKEDIGNIIKRAKEAKVSDIIVIGMDEASNQRAIELSQQHDILHATVGVHPLYVEGQNTTHLVPLIESHRVVAIGECGIDLFWETNNLSLQKKIFIEQIELAKQYELPLVIHTRNSFKEAYNCLLPYKGKVHGVFHCFSSTIEDAHKAIELGFMIGIDGPVTYKKAIDLVELIKAIDLKHLLVETDSPYLSPHPHRGKPNEPSYVHYVIEAIAKIKAISYDEVARQTTQNAYQMFRLGGNTK